MVSRPDPPKAGMVGVKRRKIRLTDVPARQALLDESPHE